jgi:hypothetical protein
MKLAFFIFTLTVIVLVSGCSNSYNHPAESENITVRFYYWDYSSYLKFPYHEEEIYRQELLSEVMYFMSLYNGILMHDLWRDEETLYVNLKPEMLTSFRIGWGSLPWAASMTRTLLGLPDVTNVVFFLDGQIMPHIYNEFCINERRFLWSDEMDYHSVMVREWFYP